MLVRAVAAEPTIRKRLAGRQSRVSAADASDADVRVYEMMRERFEQPSRSVLVVETGVDLASARIPRGHHLKELRFSIRRASYR